MPEDGAETWRVIQALFWISLAPALCCGCLCACCCTCLCMGAMCGDKEKMKEMGEKMKQHKMKMDQQKMQQMQNNMN